jgi:hypothetical protein
MVDVNRIDDSSVFDLHKEISSRQCSRRAKPPSKLLVLSLGVGDSLIDQLHREDSGVPTYGALPIRQLYHRMGFDERTILGWRLEHKLLQAVVLEHFVPNCVPASVGMSKASTVDEKTHFVKPTLGFGSSQQTEEFRKSAISGSPREPFSTILEEQWLVQDRLPISKEFRVHSVEDAVVPDLTFSRHERKVLRAERSGPNNYVQSVIDKLPNALVSGSIAGWDIGLLESGEYRVIEINWSGLHPVYRPGFQASGFFTLPPMGPYLIARLLRFVECQYHVEICVDSAGGGPIEARAFYDWIRRWKQVLHVADLVHQLDKGRFEPTGGFENAIPIYEKLCKTLSMSVDALG